MVTRGRLNGAGRGGSFRVFQGVGEASGRVCGQRDEVNECGVEGQKVRPVKGAGENEVREESTLNCNKQPFLSARRGPPLAAQRRRRLSDRIGKNEC